LSQLDRNRRAIEAEWAKSNDLGKKTPPRVGFRAPFSPEGNRAQGSVGGLRLQSKESFRQIAAPQGLEIQRKSVPIARQDRPPGLEAGSKEAETRLESESSFGSWLARTATRSPGIQRAPLVVSSSSPTVQVEELAIRARAGAGLVQRLPADQIHIGSRYRYNQQGGGVAEGTLLAVARGGWYTFDTGKARGAANVLVALAPAGPVADVAPPIEVDMVDVEGSSGEEAEEEDVVVPAIRTLFTQTLDELGVGEPGVRNLLIELNEQEIAFYRDGRRGALRRVVADWTQYTSCFATAERLFNLLGDAEGGTGTWADENLAQNAIPVLLGDFGDVPVIYRIGFGATAHSFVLLLYAGRAEILQSFAGAEGQALAANLESEVFSFTVGQVSDIFRALVGDNAVQRGQAQDRLFEGRIDAHTEVADGMGVAPPADVRQFRVRIDRRPLWSPEVLLPIIRAQIEASLKAFRG